MYVLASSSIKEGKRTNSSCRKDEKDHYNIHTTAIFYKALLYRTLYRKVQIASKRSHSVARSKAKGKKINEEASLSSLDLTHTLLSSVKKIPVS